MTKTHSIFIVDDEVTIREVVHRYLELDGFTVIEAETGPQALKLLQEKHADLILLDIMLPGLDGFSLARTLRNAPEYSAAYGAVPIIMLTSRGNEVDRLAGFELGVDDYVVKPFSPRELVARVKAVLRRSVSDSLNTTTEKPLEYTNLQVDPLRRSVFVKGQPVTLTAREFDLLWLFARHPQQVFTREQLLNQVWGYEFYGDESTVTVHIRRLREKIEPDPAQPTYIQTVWGVGYKFEPEP
ncbi:MAG: response regulator transcription factor [Anaerolineae bacterium]